MLYTNYFQDHRKKKLHVHYYDNEQQRQTKEFSLDTFTYYTQSKTKGAGLYKDIWGNTYDKQTIPYTSLKNTREFVKEMDNIENNAELFMNPDRKISRLFNQMGDISGNIYNANIAIFDIETRISDDSLDTVNAPSPMVSIALHIIKEEITYLFAYHKDTKYVELENCKVIACRDEADMIMKFIDTYLNKKIDILSGWNCLSRHKNPTGSYDIPYMYNRMINLGLDPKSLSPYRIVDIKPKTTKEGITFDTYFIRGIQILDYLDLYFYMTKTEQKKYSLDYISYLVLKKNKVDYDGNLNDLYDEDIKKFLYYNAVDCTLIAEMDRKLGYFQSYCATGWKSDTNFEEVVNTNIFIENFFHKAFTKRGFVIRDIDTNGREKEKFEGAFVYANVKGHKYGVNNDFNSMYPWLIIMYNISPETKVLEHEIEEKGYTLDDLIKTPLDGVYYVKPSIKKGIVPDILEELYNERLELKAKMNEAKLNGDLELAKIYHSEQLVVKIILNSTYGYFGFYKAKYYDLDNARVITSLGQDLIKYSRDFIVEFLANAHTNKELIEEFGNIERISGMYEDLILEFLDDVKKVETKSELFRLTRILSKQFRNIDDFEKEIVKVEEKCLDLEKSKKGVLGISQIVDTSDVLMLIDTDSVVGDSIIHTDKGDIKIEDLFDENNIIETRGENNFVSKCKGNLKSLSMNTSYGVLEYGKINYVMKHKVEKQMFKIKNSEYICEPREVIVTKDHSVIILRYGEYVDVKPSDILPTDRIIMVKDIENVSPSEYLNKEKLKNFNYYFIPHESFEVIDLGIQELWVYDIEVENNHNFFANDILVHNSVYFSIDKLFQSALKNNWKGLSKDLVVNKKTGKTLYYKDASEEEKETIEFVNFADKFYDIFDVFVETKLDEFGALYNTENLMVFGREKYMRQLISIAKKKYIMDVAWDDGTIKADFNLKYKGFELTKTDTTIYAKEKITGLIRTIFDGVKNSHKTTEINGLIENAGLVTIIQELDEMRKTFKYEDPNKISMFGKVNKYKKYIEFDEEAGVEVYKSRTNSRLKASMYHNRFMKDQGLLSTYRRIEDGYKVNVMFIHNNTSYNADRISWSGEFPEIYYDYFDFDYNLLFEKTVIPIVQRITDTLEWDLNFDILNEDNIFNAF